MLDRRALAARPSAGESDNHARPRAAVRPGSARAEASRRNGAKSRGPKTPEGKARSAQNALKHGLRAQKLVLLPDEDAAAFKALEAALVEQLVPVGALQCVLARRIAVAAWRLERADRLEVEVLEHRRYGDAGPGLALIRDGNGTRSFETLLRYRASALAELMRSLKAFQADQKATPMRAAAAEPAPVLTFQPRRKPAAAALDAPGQIVRQAAARERKPIEPEARANSGRPAPAAPASTLDQRPSTPAPARPCEPGPAPAFSPAPASRGPETNEPDSAARRAASRHLRYHEARACNRTPEPARHSVRAVTDARRT